MALTKFETNVNNHQGQADKPALTSDELKKLFDKAPGDIKNYLNNTLIPELDETLKDTVGTTNIVNDISQGGTDKVASAEIVKNLNINKQDKIIIGGTEPTELEEGQIYIQVF